MNRSSSAFSFAISLSLLLSTFLSSVSGQDSPVAIESSRKIARGFVESRIDPIARVQVMQALKISFPNITKDRGTIRTLERALDDPTMRGNLRGHLAESDWINRNRSSGWVESESRIDSQFDAVRRDAGRVVERAQVKVLSSVDGYIPAMRKDSESERFVVPDDHERIVREDLQTRRMGALRGGDAAKVAEYDKMLTRLTKMGRDFGEYDNALSQTQRFHQSVSQAMKASGRFVSLLTIAEGFLDLTISAKEIASGAIGVNELVVRMAKSGVSWGASLAASKAAATLAAASNSMTLGIPPVAVAVVVGGLTYLVVDWALEMVSESFWVTPLTAEEIVRFLPDTAKALPRGNQ